LREQSLLTAAPARELTRVAAIRWKGNPMKSLRKIKITLLLALIGIGVAGSLSACIIEDDGHGGHERHDWR
jgi:hypothetical protein